MNILFFCSGFLVSGKEFIDLAIVKSLKERGHNVFVVFSGWNDGEFEKKLIEIGVEYKAIKLGWYYLTKISWSLDSLKNYPPSIRSILRIRKRFSPDVYYFDSFRFIFLLKPFLKGKVFYHVHDVLSRSRSNKFFLRAIDSKITKYIAASEYVKKDLASLGIREDKVEVVYNGTEVTDFDIAKEYFHDDVMKIGIVGQVIEHKGHLDLLKACTALPDFVKYEVHIYGKCKNTYKEELKLFIEEKGITDKVQWHGFVADRRKIYEGLDVLVAPSTVDEAFGLMSIEAAIFKLPVILYRSGGLAETVIEGETGFVVDKHDHKAITEKLNYFYNNKSLAKEFGEKARSLVLSKFTNEVMLDNIEKVISNN